jgi:hypothetical protein
VSGRARHVPGAPIFGGMIGGTGPANPIGASTAARRSMSRIGFGTNEFIRCCKLTSAQPYLAANLRSLPAQAFWQWVECCNAPAGQTTYSDLRAAAGGTASLSTSASGASATNPGGVAASSGGTSMRKNFAAGNPGSDCRRSSGRGWRRRHSLRRELCGACKTGVCERETVDLDGRQPSRSKIPP